MESEILINKKKNKEIMFTLNKTNFTMINKKIKYERDYKIEDIIKLMKKDNWFTIELYNKINKIDNLYTLISENTDWYDKIKSNIFNINKIIIKNYLLYKNNKNKNVFCLLNKYYFRCFSVNDNKKYDANIEKILNINLNDVIDIYSTKSKDEITCFTIELKNKKYTFDANNIEEKEKWIKEIGIATIKNKYPQYFNNNNNCISEFVELVPDN
jgi:hypothetical protein